MNTSKTRELPARLEAVRRRFEQWRRTHRPRSRLPNGLWAAAVKMAGVYGLYRTSRALPVEYYSLKKRVELQAARGRHKPGPVAAFVELPPPAPIGTCECMLELEDAAGSKMRVSLKAAAPPDLAALCRAFRDGAP